MTRRRKRTLGALFISGMLVSASPSCSSDNPRDQNYGKEAGADFEAPPDDGAADAADAGVADAGVSETGGSDGGASDAQDLDAGPDAGATDG